MSRRRRRHRHHALPRRASSLAARTASTRSRCTSTGGGRARARVRHAGLRRASTSACAARPSCRRTSQPSIGDFLAGLRAAGSTAGRDIVSVHIVGRHLGHRRSPRARRRRADRGAASRAARRRSRLATRRCGGIGLVRARRRGRGARRAATSTRWPRARARPRERDARSGSRSTRSSSCAAAAASAPRRRGSARALKIKPILTLDARDHAGRARAHRRPRVRAHGRLPQGSASEDGADGWVVQHIQAPERGRAAGRARPRDLRHATPLFVSEIGPVIGAHVGPGLLGVGGVPAELGSLG